MRQESKDTTIILFIVLNREGDGMLKTTETFISWPALVGAFTAARVSTAVKRRNFPLMRRLTFGRGAGRPYDARYSLTTGAWSKAKRVLLCTCFIDLMAEYSSVDRAFLWDTLQ